MAELSIFTKQLQAMLPQWMKMAKDPNSVGAQFLNVFGLEFEDIRSYLDETISNQSIGGAEIGQIDIVYKVPIATSTIIDMNSIDTVIGRKDSIDHRCTIVNSIREFYSAPPDEHVAILDRTESLVYVRPSSDLIDANREYPYEIVLINGITHYDIITHHIWNAFDEFGLLLGLRRLFGERNEAFKNRILDVFVNPGNATRGGLINALSREFGIDKADVVLNELSDTAFKDSLLNADGSPTQKLISYAQQVNKVLGFTWDNMSWDEAYWRSIEEANVGIDYLPHVWTASLANWSNEFIQSGIGDGDDLLVRAPEKLDNIRDFKYLVGVRGVIKEGNLVYPEHSFKYKIVAKGSILNQESRPENYKYTVIASEIIYLHFIIRAFQQYNYLTSIDFTNLTGFRYDVGNNLEVVDGTTIMSPKAHRFLEVQSFMETSDQTATPQLNVLSVNWKDTTGVDNTFTLDTQVDFDRNDPTVTTTKQNVITTPIGDVELGYGDFYHVINTEGDWKKGTTINVDILNTGSIRLVQPKI